MRPVSRSELFKSANEAQKYLGGEAIVDKTETKADESTQAEVKAQAEADPVSDKQNRAMKVTGVGTDSGRTVSTVDIAAPTADNTDLAELDVSGLKTKPDYRSPAEKQAEFGSLQDQIGDNEDIFKSRVAESAADHVLSHLTKGKCTASGCVHNKGVVTPPVVSGPSFKRKTFSGEGSADAAWKTLMDVHDRIRSHYDSIGGPKGKLQGLANEYDRRANVGEKMVQDYGIPKVAKVVGKAIGIVRDNAAFMRNQASTSVLREHLGVDNNLVEASSILRGLKDENGNFKSTASADSNAFIIKAAQHLKTANGILNRSILSKHGLGSPVSSSEMSDITSALRYKETPTETGGKKTKGLQVPKNKVGVQSIRDIDPLVADYEEDGVTLTNPKEAMSKPGHMWITTNRDENGVAEQHPISSGLMTKLKNISTQHADIPRLQSFLNQTKGVGQRKVYSGRAAVGVPLEKTGGVVDRAGGPSRAVGEVTPSPSIKDWLKERDAASNKTSKTKTTVEEPAGPRVFERTTESGMNSLIREAHDHIVGGTATGVPGSGQIPKPLRKTIGMAGISRATEMASETMKAGQ